MRTTIGPAPPLGRRAGIRASRAALSRATFAVTLHGSPRLDRRERRDLQDLIRQDPELLAEHPTRLGAGSRSEERSDDETDYEEKKRCAQGREHQAARPLGGENGKEGGGGKREV